MTALWEWRESLCRLLVSQYQLLPYKRIEEYFTDQLGIPLSSGTLVRFN
jgi:hypothetical protein